MLLRFLFLVAVVDSAVFPLSITARPATAPNLLFIFADDVGWDDVGYHGSVAETPNIDRLVSEGLELDRHYTAPICGPSRVALMTGRNPAKLGIRNNLEDIPGLDLAEYLLPQAFHNAGYQTWCLGKWHLGGEEDPAYLPIHRGFDYFYGYLGAGINACTHRPARSPDIDWQRNGEPLDETGTFCDDLLTADAIRLLRERDAARPFFLYLAYHMIHMPMDAPPAPSPEKYAAKGVDDERRQLQAARIEALDMNVGRVLAALDEAGLRENTLVVFASDNGGGIRREGSSNAPLRGGKGTTWEGGIRTPAALRWPGVIEPGSRTEQVFSLMDWFPTLVSAFGLSAKNDAARPFHGHDRWPVLTGQEEPVPPKSLVISAVGYTAVIDGDWKLVWTREDSKHLFDLTADPEEKHDLADEFPDIAAVLETIAIQEVGGNLRGGGGGGRRERRGRARE